MSQAPRLPAGFQLTRLATVGSTNDEAKRLAAAGAPGGTIVWALEQTAGKGRRARVWDSRPGNLYCSVILRPDVAAGVASQLGFVTALAVGAAVEALARNAARVEYKWPNDVLLNGKKVSGILLEAASGSGPEIDWLVLGSGINLAHFPAATEIPATSILQECGGEASVGAALERYIEALDDWLARWKSSGFEAVRSAWLEKATGLGEAIVVRLDDREMAGQFRALDGEGALVLATDQGEARVTVGDVYFPGRRD